MSNKREKDRQSGTGQPINGKDIKGGGGQNNWGSSADAIKDGVADASAPAPGGDGNQRQPRRREPNSLRDLNAQQEPAAGKVSWDEFKKQDKKRSKTKTAVFNTKTVESKNTYKKHFSRKRYEKETDAMLFGGGKKKRGKKKKKKQKVVLKTEVFFATERERDAELRGRGRGPGRGRGRGRGRGDSTRGGGYRGGGGGRGGYGGRGGGGFGGRGGGGGGGYGGGYGGGFGGGYGGGFGGRGRGYVSNAQDNSNSQNYQNNSEYQGGGGGDDGQGQASGNVQGNINDAAPQQQNQEQTNIPVAVQ